MNRPVVVLALLYFTLAPGPAGAQSSSGGVDLAPLMWLAFVVVLAAVGFMAYKAFGPSVKKRQKKKG